MHLPVEAFFLNTECGHGFLGVQPINGVVQSRRDGSFEAVVPKEVGSAVEALRKYRPKIALRKMGRESVQVPAELQKLLSTLPKGYKLGVGADGQYKIIKSCERKRG